MMDEIKKGLVDVESVLTTALAHVRNAKGSAAKGDKKNMWLAVEAATTCLKWSADKLDALDV